MPVAEDSINVALPGRFSWVWNIVLAPAQQILWPLIYYLLWLQDRGGLSASHNLNKINKWAPRDFNIFLCLCNLWTLLELCINLDFMCGVKIDGDARFSVICLYSLMQLRYAERLQLFFCFLDHLVKTYTKYKFAQCIKA